ncbi:hypothetical protein NQZ68_008909 [Dissostichus eleginoides]|nr:hypothetical protein NQZ68_008909 [Dissostichus eleginoides]
MEGNSTVQEIDQTAAVPMLQRRIKTLITAGRRREWKRIETRLCQLTYMYLWPRSVHLQEDIHFRSSVQNANLPEIVLAEWSRGWQDTWRMSEWK